MAEQSTCVTKMLEMQQQLQAHKTQAQEDAHESSSVHAFCKADLEQKLLTAQAAAAKESAYSAELEQKLITAQAAVAAAKKDLDALFKQMSQKRAQAGDERSQLVCELQDMRSKFDELQLKFNTLQENNNRLLKTNANLEQQLKTTQEKATYSAMLSEQLKILQAEKQELQTNLTATINEAGKCSRTMVDDVAHHKELLEQQVESYNKLRTLLNTKESAFKEEKQKLEGTVSCLMAEKKILEERLYATEVALKKFDELTSMQKKSNESPNNSMDANTSYSPRSRKSFERLMGENNQLKSMNLNLEDKLMSMQQKKTLQLDSAERRSRRLSTHDEHRRQSLWGSVRDASTMTDPNDSTCNCIQLDEKLQECQRNLFIRESQVTALNMEIKNHPLKSENIMLKKRLQDEQEKSRNEIKKYKRFIVEQKTRPTTATSLHKESEKPASTIIKSTTVHMETQTDSEVESVLRKLESKYNDLKNICRYRHRTIKELEEQVALLSKEKENSSSNVPLSSLEAGQIKATKQQCEQLKKELNIYKQKYEDAKKLLHMRHAEILSLRGQLTNQTTT